MDELICCLLGICCPPFSPEHREAFETQLTLHFNGDSEKAKDVADKTYDDFARTCRRLADEVKKHDKKKD